MSGESKECAGSRGRDACRAALFDEGQGAWVLSRFADVWAALRDPNLWPVSGKREIQPETRDEAGRLKERAAMLDSLSAAQVEAWRPQLEAATASMLADLPTDRPVDLFREFTLPWGLSLAMLGLQANPVDRERLMGLGNRVFAATGASSDDAALRADAAAATAELAEIFANAPMPMGEPTFVALSQTLPRLLASCWLGLLRHPEEVARLRADPELMPGAIEELLRHGGIVRRVYRRATADLEIGGIRIARGELVMLMLASANLDPGQFTDAERVVVSRPVTNHVALGAGRNSCVGAMLIRMAASVATRLLLARFDGLELCGVGELQTGSGFCFPSSVMVQLTRS
ncbi:MAG: cytochrome P450 [Candidatus Solibacter sp.]